MHGLMQYHPLLVSSLLKHAARYHGNTEIVSKRVEGDIHRYTYAEAERRTKRLVRALQRLGVKESDRVATLAWNGYRHFEIYYAASGMGAVVHTVNPRLHESDISYIINHAGSTPVFADITFAPLIEKIAPGLAGQVRDYVFMSDEANMPPLELPGGVRVHCYESLVAESVEDYEWPLLDEGSASGLCYTSGTTGRPKGVVYSHRSTVLHAYAVSTADAFGLRAIDRVMPIVPMFHVNAWGVPYAAPLNGAAIVFPGRHLDGASLASLFNAEGVTMALGVPTVWMGLLQHMQRTGERLETEPRILTGGSACPPMLLETFTKEYGLKVCHAWGMTEISPVGTCDAPKPAHLGESPEAEMRRKLKQGRALAGIDLKIVSDAGEELPWDGKAFGDLKVRGSWVASGYFGGQPGSALDEEGWFTTGDVCTIDPEGYMQITDRSKDVVKSGGEWISSIQLENIAVSHPDVAEAAVIAARHPKWDERPLLILLPKPGHTVNPQAVLKVYEGKVSKWWLPDAVVVVAEMPHTATGKLQKSVLRERYRDYLTSGGCS
ncbi:MAG: long-chain-fatty-acid--CoA ligase [Acetobacteraceae bacterium]|nr:long-chain-fatty-acid--CoA ligase [Acetobacteraceae bacterium]